MIRATFLLGFLGFGLMANAAPVLPSLDEHVDLALKLNEQSDSLEEWQQIGLTPEYVFQVVNSTNDPSAWAVLCRKLSTLNDHDLAFFEREISDGEHAPKLNCGPKLRQRLAKHWVGRERVLTQIHDGEHTDPIGPTTEHPTLPSVEKLIDVSKGPIYTDGELKRGEIAITLDDGPHPTLTPVILKTLKDWGVRATFFSVGEMARNSVDAAKRRNDGTPNLVREEVLEGHTVGSHSWNHPQLSRLPMANAENNILRGYAAVTAASGLETPFFRFPYGASTKLLRNWVSDLKMATFFWNMDSSDWKLRDPVALFKNVLKQLDTYKGGIILFHDIQRQTSIVMPHVLEELQRRKFTTVVFVPDRGTTNPRP